MIDWDSIDVDAFLCLRPGLTQEQRVRLVELVMAAAEADIRKGVDGGGSTYAARLSASAQ